MSHKQNAPGLREQAAGASDHTAGGSLHMLPHVPLRRNALREATEAIRLGRTPAARAVAG